MTKRLGIDDDVHVFECRRLEIPTNPHPHPCGDQEPSQTSDMLELLHTSTPITSIRILLGGRQFYVYTGSRHPSAATAAAAIGVLFCCM